MEAAYLKPYGLWKLRKLCASSNQTYPSMEKGEDYKLPMLARELLMTWSYWRPGAAKRVNVAMLQWLSTHPQTHRHHWFALKLGTKSWWVRKEGWICRELGAGNTVCVEAYSCVPWHPHRGQRTGHLSGLGSLLQTVGGIRDQAEVIGLSVQLFCALATEISRQPL